MISCRYPAYLVLLMIVAVVMAAGCFGESDGEVLEGDDSGLPATSPIAIHACTVTRSTLSRAAQLHRQQVGTMPEDIRSLRNALTKEPRCLSRGEYHILENGTVECTVHGR